MKLLISTTLLCFILHSLAYRCDCPYKPGCLLRVTPGNLHCCSYDCSQRCSWLRDCRDCTSDVDCSWCNGRCIDSKHAFLQCHWGSVNFPWSCSPPPRSIPAQRNDYMSLTSCEPCSHDPCTNTRCPAFPSATCVSDPCSCRKQYHLNGHIVDCNFALPGQVPTCTEREMVQCFVDPCTVTTCPEHPNAYCVSNYCFGCNAIFLIDGMRVQCSTTPTPATACYKGGCSGEVCSSSNNTVSPCIFRCEFGCYQYATCDLLQNGSCGWTPTSDEYNRCVENCKSCLYNGIRYPPGATFPATDGCNSCSCDNGVVLCTLIACPLPPN